MTSFSSIKLIVMDIYAILLFIYIIDLIFQCWAWNKWNR